MTETFRSVGGDSCVNSIQAGFWQVPLLSPPEITQVWCALEGALALVKPCPPFPCQAFNTCTPADSLTANFVTGLVFGWAGGAAETG